MIERVVSPTRKPRAYVGTELFIVRTKLKLRESRYLDSKEVGHVQDSTFVCVLDRANLPDGTSRAHIAMVNINGKSTPLGWASCYGKDQRANLLPFHWTLFQRERRIAVPEVQAPGHSEQNAPDAASPTLAVVMPSVDAKPSRVSSQSATKTSKEKRSASSAKKLGAPHLSRAVSAPAVAPAAADAAAAPIGANATMVALDFDTKRAKGSRPSAEQSRAADRFRPQTAQELREVVSEYAAQMAAEERKLLGRSKDLKAALGAALSLTSQKVSTIIKTWGGKSGDVTKIAFRKHVRATLEWPNVKDIDGLFMELDRDGGGTLDIAELQTAMKKLAEKAKAIDATASVVRDSIQFFQDRIDLATRVADTTAEAEDADRRLEGLRGFKTPSAKLGAELLRRNTKISDLVNSWDATDGEVDKRQWRKNVKTFGIDESEADLDEIFDSIDLDGGGTLDLDELKAAMGSLREVSLESDREVTRLKKLTGELWKVYPALPLSLRVCFVCVMRAYCSCCSHCLVTLFHAHLEPWPRVSPTVA